MAARTASRAFFSIGANRTAIMQHRPLMKLAPLSSSSLSCYRSPLLPKQAARSTHLVLAVAPITRRFMSTDSSKKNTSTEAAKANANDADRQSGRKTILSYPPPEFVAKIQNASEAQLYHWSSLALAGSFPLALILSPSFLNVPVDLALGIALPLHMHIGLIQVLEDYVPREYQQYAKYALYVITFFTAYGLLKINLCGSGITESLKSLWRRPPQKQLKH